MAGDKLFRLIFLALLFSFSAHAGNAVIWSSPYPEVLGPGISFNSTDSSAVCSAMTAGIRFNSPNLQFCDGLTWHTLSASSISVMTGATDNGIVSVSWGTVVGATAGSGGSITKTASTNWGNSGAFGTVGITSGQQVYFTTPITNGTAEAGLSATNSGNSYTDIQYGFNFFNAACEIQEAGVNVQSCGTVTTAHIYSIKLQSGVIKYYIDGVLQYTSSGTPAATMYAKISLYGNGDNLLTATQDQAGADGTSGLVPQPVIGDQSYFLRGDATWALPSAVTSVTCGTGLTGGTFTTTGTCAVSRPLPSPTPSGHYLMANGTSWVDAAGGSGTVTSVTCGTGMSGGTITTTGTCAVAQPLPSPTPSGHYLMANGTSWVDAAASSGTVTSVTCGTGMSGGTITGSGTCAVSLPLPTATPSGGPLVANGTNWVSTPNLVNNLGLGIAASSCHGLCQQNNGDNTDGNLTLFSSSGTKKVNFYMSNGNQFYINLSDATNYMMTQTSAGYMAIGGVGSPETGTTVLVNQSADLVMLSVKGNSTQTHNLQQWETSTPTVLAAINQNGAFNSSVTKTTLNGSAGTAVCSEPFAGSSYKKVICYLSGFTDTASQVYTFPTAFTNTPVAIYTTVGATPTIATTTVAFTSTTTTGYVILEGY